MKAAREAARLGYTNVHTFRDGIPGWVAAGYELDTSQALTEYKISTLNTSELFNSLDNVLVVDVRNNSEVENMGAFPNSIHMPFEDLERRYEEIPMEKQIVVIDFSGVEYRCAANFLKSKGYNNVKGLLGGVKDWIKQGNALIK